VLLVFSKVIEVNKVTESQVIDLWHGSNPGNNF
jgi:hypothetical protein